MKPSFLTFILLAFASIAHSQNVVFSDPDFKSAILAQTPYDLNVDGEISFSEANQVLTLILSSNPLVSDLGGIEHFSNIEHLSISGSPLTTFDLTQNTKLRDLWLKNCNLTSVNALLFPTVENLELSNNSISTIDLLPLSDLEYLRMSFNQLSILDVSQNPKLKFLILDNNNLATIDLSVLGCSLNELWLFNNPLVSLDITNHSELYELQLFDMPQLNEVCVWPEFISDSLMSDPTLFYSDTNSPNVDYQLCYAPEACNCTDALNAQEEIPNVFSPNNDGMNDQFEIPFYDLEIVSFEIYNRWGNSIFRTEAPTQLSWDGNDMQNQSVPEGTYYWRFEYAFGCSDIVKFEKTGVIAVFR